MNEFENLKVGDLVVVRGNIIAGEELSKIERVTNSQIVISNRRYRKKDGRLVGEGNWHYGFIKPATEKDIERINEAKQKDELLTFIRRVAWCNLSLESLETICDVVKKEIGDSAAKQ